MVRFTYCALYPWEKITCYQIEGFVGCKPHVDSVANIKYVALSGFEPQFSSL